MPNSNFGKLYIKKRNFEEWIVFAIIMLPFTFALFVELFNIPDVIRFIIDALLVVLCSLGVLKRYYHIQRKVFPLFVIFSLFLLYTVIAYLFNYESLFLYVWGLRNNFRFYIAFFLFVVFVKEQDAERFFEIFDILYWINLVVCVFQFFAMDLKQDYLGGLFGAEKGCNAYLNVFICIVVTKSIIYFFNKRETVASVLAKVLVAFFISAIAEIKFFFLEFVLIVCVATLITKFTWRKLIIIIASIASICAGLFLLTQIFPEHVGAFTLQAMIESSMAETGYTNSGDLNRLTAIHTISNNILTSVPDKLFGIGLGNGDLSSLSIFNSAFYQKYSFLNYNWFSHAFLFVETGYVGLLLFLLFFVVCIILTIKLYKQNQAKKEFCQIAVTIAMLCFILVFYNVSLRMESAYMIYFVLSLPFLKHSSSNNQLSEGLQNERITTKRI